VPAKTLITGILLKKLTTWNEWEAGEHKQLDQFYGQKMFGDAIDPMLLPKQAVVLRPHWNYIVKRSGVCRASVVMGPRWLHLNYML
jgi:hypothetical protein